ncbi:MAG TPA: NPCBM/NEW2 domain-containing protein [Thermoguttaceae bacterium]
MKNIKGTGNGGLGIVLQLPTVDRPLSTAHFYCNGQFAISMVLILLLFPCLAMGVDIPTAVPVNGPAFNAESISIDGKGQITFQTAGQKRQMPLGDLVAWGECLEPKRTPILVLSDGGLLVADVVAVDKETASVESQLFGRLKLPLSDVAGVVYRLPAEVKDRDALFDRIIQATGKSDRLILDNGDELAGVIESIKESAVSINTDVGQIAINFDRITSIIFNPTSRRKISSEEPKIWLGFIDGSRLIVSGLQLDASGMQFTMMGQTWKSDPKNLVFIQPLTSRTIYLSDLRPSEYQFVPFLDLNWPYCMDRSVTGSFLRADGALYLKGIGMHSTARLIYKLDRPYKRFQAELAIDDSTQGSGSVQFRVFVDGQDKFTSGIIRGGMKPLPISVDISGAKRLDLIVEFADRADVQDHADWLNARLVK